jgi:hypothetical protein
LSSTASVLGAMHVNAWEILEKNICKMQCGVSDTCNVMWTLNWTLKISVQQSCTILTQAVEGQGMKLQ